jgi:hypothetical protein
MTIGNYVPLPVPDISDVLASGWIGINIWRSSTPFNPGTKIAHADLPKTLIADQRYYDFQDTAGAADSWYRTSLWNGSADGELSAPVPAGSAPTTDALTLVRKVAERLGCKVYPETEHERPGPSGTTTSSGATTSQVISTQYADAGLAAPSASASRVYRGHYLAVRGGVYSGQERRILTLNTTGGVFDVGVPFGGTIVNGVAFDILALRPTAWWVARLNEARLDLFYPYEHYLTGPSPSDTGSRTHFPLPYWVEDRTMVSDVEQRFGAALDEWTYGESVNWSVQDISGGGVRLYISGGIPENSVYVVRGNRHPRPIGAIIDAFAVPELLVRMWVAKAALRAAQNLWQHPDDLGDRRKLWKDLIEGPYGLAEEVAGYDAETNAFDVVYEPGNEPFVPVGNGP